MAEFTAAIVPTDAIPQTEPLQEGMVANSAGGFVFAVDDMSRLRRFLCLGSEGGSYYATEQQLGLENAQAIKRLLNGGHGAEVVATIAAFATEGRAAKQNPGLFALAMCARLGSEETRRLAYAALGAVCRIPTNLFMFIGFCEAFGPGTGWGRCQKRAVTEWYNGKDAAALGMLVTKYQNREGWTHTDMLRLAHIRPATGAHNLVYKYVTKGWAGLTAEDAVAAQANAACAPVWAFLHAVHQAKAADEALMVRLIHEHRLVREHVPTQLLAAPAVWEALLQDMPMTAMLRNLAKMTAIGVLRPLGEWTATVCKRLRDAGALRRARVHPMSVLIALETYRQGHGDKGKLAWDPVPEIVAALDDAFYAAFAAVTPTGRRFVLALDVSGSMGCTKVTGSPMLTPRTAAAAMSMVTARTESRHAFVAFSHTIVPLGIDAGMRLEDVVQVTSGLPFGATDCAQPMLWALATGLEADVFVVFTDCETFYGDIHPVAALRQYRAATGIAARLIVVAMSSNGFTIADPEDAGMLDVVGFDASAPEVMRQFILGEV